MTAIAQGRLTDQLDGPHPLPHSYTFPQKADEVIYFGTLVGIDTSGRAVSATATSTIKIVGVLDEIGNQAGHDAQDATGLDDGDLTAKVLQGVFKFVNGDSITVANLFAPCYCVDNQTVAKSSNSGARPRVGLIVGVESDGVYVLIASGLEGAAGSAASSVWTQTYSTANRTVAAPTGTAPNAATGATPVTLTDNTGLSGTHDDTLAATTVPAALTENGGAIGGTSDGNLPALVDPAGDAGASVIAGIRENATRINTLQTLLGVMVQNASDTAQKVIELVAQVTALLADDASMRTQITALVADDLDNRQSINGLIDDLQTAGTVS